MAKKILQKNDPVLRQVAESVPLDEIKTAKIQKILQEMKDALLSQDDGVAIAAPQIGYPLRIFVVSRKVKKLAKGEEPSVDDIGEDEIYINPVIKKLSKDKKMMEEGCLSVRYLYGKVNRSSKATVEAYDENGIKFQRGGTGLIAQIFQHETDHLDGTLFIDKAVNVEEIIPENNLTSNERN